jgi:hypothetical protein
MTAPGNTPYPLELNPFEVKIVKDGANAFRAGVRELAHYGADHVKIHTTGPFYFKPNGEVVNQALPSLEELKAVVDEAHRRGMFVASHTSNSGYHSPYTKGNFQLERIITGWRAKYPVLDLRLKT